MKRDNAMSSVKFNQKMIQLNEKLARISNLPSAELSLSNYGETMDLIKQQRKFLLAEWQTDIEKLGTARQTLNVSYFYSCVFSQFPFSF